MNNQALWETRTVEGTSQRLAIDTTSQYFAFGFNFGNKLLFKIAFMNTLYCFFIFRLQIGCR